MVVILSIDYEKIANEVVDGNFQYLMKCLYDPDFDVHHQYNLPGWSTSYKDGDTDFNLLQIIALLNGGRWVEDEYILIVEELLSKGLTLDGFSDYLNAMTFSFMCGAYSEPPVELLDLLVAHGAVINPPSTIGEDNITHLTHLDFNCSLFAVLA